MDGTQCNPKGILLNWNRSWFGTVNAISGSFLFNIHQLADLMAKVSLYQLNESKEVSSPFLSLELPEFGVKFLPTEKTSNHAVGSRYVISLLNPPPK